MDEHVVGEFKGLIENELFVGITSGIEHKFKGWSTSLSYLTLKYVYSVGNRDLVLKVMGSKTMGGEGVYGDHFKCSFAYLKDDEIDGDVRVYEGFKAECVTFYAALVKKLGG